MDQTLQSPLWEASNRLYFLFVLQGLSRVSDRGYKIVDLCRQPASFCSIFSR